MSFATKILFNLFKAIKKIAITCLIYNLRKKKKKKLVVFRWIPCNDFIIFKKYILGSQKVLKNVYNLKGHLNI
jgi:hypothetical protein